MPAPAGPVINVNGPVVESVRRSSRRFLLTSVRGSTGTENLTAARGSPVGSSCVSARARDRRGARGSPPPSAAPAVKAGLAGMATTVGGVRCLVPAAVHALPFRPVGPGRERPNTTIVTALVRDRQAGPAPAP
ncbi:hypothetical protein GCM10020367_60690 [Streptomyces sannanensis]|uniref:Uncharacterized protein n=1 Tax=Streptomyces sannanensis TaxID=285536 RepID=A0ABP6SK58_9ACTN